MDSWRSTRERRAIALRTAATTHVSPHAEFPLPRRTPAGEWTTATSWSPGSRLDVPCITFPDAEASSGHDANTPLTVAGAAWAFETAPEFPIESLSRDTRCARRTMGQSRRRVSIVAEPLSKRDDGLCGSTS